MDFLVHCGFDGEKYATLFIFMLIESNALNDLNISHFFSEGNFRTNFFSLNFFFYFSYRSIIIKLTYKMKLCCF